MYSYDAGKINDGGLNQMRFELGDCLEEPEKTGYLSDEEISATLEAGSFKRAKLRLVETLLMRFSYEVDTEIREASWKLSERVAFWKDLHRRLKAEIELEGVTSLLRGKKHRRPIFNVTMHDWRQ